MASPRMAPGTLSSCPPWPELPPNSCFNPTIMMRMRMRMIMMMVIRRKRRERRCSPTHSYFVSRVVAGDDPCLEGNHQVT